MITLIKENIYQITFSKFGSCVYLIKLNNSNILIDTGAKWNKEELSSSLKSLNIKPEKIDIIILTHNHWDHIGNIDLFSKAKIYGNKKDFQDNKIIALHKLDILELKIISTPGHTPGSICVLYKNILFSGDTIFHNKRIGRTDLAGGDYELLKQSIQKLQKLDYSILCPGHV